MRKILFIFTFLLSSSFALSRTPYLSCAPQSIDEEFIDDFSKAVDGMYKEIATLKVKYKGEYKISVFFEDDQPKILRLSNSDDKTSITIPFSDLAEGKPLAYEDPSKPGKALYLEKNETFLKDGKYQLIFAIRSEMPSKDKEEAKFTKYPIVLDANPSNPALYKDDKKVAKIEVSPNISWLKWTGTFDKPTFK